MDHRPVDGSGTRLRFINRPGPCARNQAGQTSAEGTGSQERKALISPGIAFQARDLTKRFGRFAALAQVNLDLEHREILVLFGRNGAGKTTFLHLAATLMKPTHGELLYKGRPLSEDPIGVRRQIGFVSHASFLYPDLTARENLEFYARLYGIADVPSAIGEALARADLSTRSNSPVMSLSRGMHQRLTIARALIHRPSLLLLDEPYTGLDPLSAERLSRQIGDLARSGAAVVLTTHGVEQGLEVSDRVVILESGRIVYQRSGKHDPGEFRKTFAELTRRS